MLDRKKISRRGIVAGIGALGAYARILAFMEKVTVVEDPELTARVGDAVPTRIVIVAGTASRFSLARILKPAAAGR
jgi:hypothetical protein